MTTDIPENWKDEAREKLDYFTRRWITVVDFCRFVRIALANDDYFEYKEALLWLQAEESEPGE